MFDGYREFHGLCAFCSSRQDLDSARRGHRRASPVLQQTPFLGGEAGSIVGPYVSYWGVSEVRDQSTVGSWGGHQADVIRDGAILP